MDMPAGSPCMEVLFPRRREGQRSRREPGGVPRGRVEPAVSGVEAHANGRSERTSRAAGRARPRAAGAGWFVARAAQASVDVNRTCSLTTHLLRSISYQVFS
jgi:hypothetical protein